MGSGGVSGHQDHKIVPCKYLLSLSDPHVIPFDHVSKHSFPVIKVWSFRLFKNCVTLLVLTMAAHSLTTQAFSSARGLPSALGMHRA